MADAARESYTHLSRRAILRGCALGAGAAAAAPVLLPMARGAVLPRASLHGAGLHGAGLHGATLSLSAYPHGTTWAQAISAWQGFTGTTIQVAKLYYSENVIPTSIGSEVRACIKGGIKALLSFKPAFLPPSVAQRSALANILTLYKNAGLQATVCLWQEAEQVMNAATYRECVTFYGPTVQQFYPLAYDASGSAGPVKWLAYYPGDPLVDLIAADYYAETFVQHSYRLDELVGLADTAVPPKPFGIWEMGNSTTKTNPSQTEVRAYFSYIQSLMSGRLQAGKVNGDIAWYNGNGVNTIRASSDYRVALWDSLVSATS